MSRVYFDAKGRPQSLPIKEEAKRYRTLLYVDYDNLCPECNNHVFHTANNVCVQCARVKACDLYSYLNAKMEFDYGPDGHFTSYYKVGKLTGVANRIVSADFQKELDDLAELMYIIPPVSMADAIAKGKTLWLTGDPCEKYGHYGIRTLNNECYFCEQVRNKPKPRAEARKAGKNWYMPLEPCDKCGKIAERNVQDNRCRGCKSINSSSPRQEALKAGKRWYTPTTPCFKCNTLSERYVDNGVCKGCIPNREKSEAGETPDVIMMKAQPDLIIIKETAATLGMKVYRTGKQCRRGHTGYRYVSTNNCIDCLKGRSHG